MLSVLKTFWSLVGENCIMPKKKRLKSYETIRKYGRDRARKSRKNRQLKRANREGQKTDNVIQTEEKVVGLDEHDSNEDDENGSGGHDDTSSKTEYTKKPEPEEDARTSGKTKYPKKPAPEEGMMLTLSWNIPEDVLRRANASLPNIAEDESEDEEEDTSVIRISVDELQEENQSVMKISVDLPYEREGIYDSVEEKYSDVLRRDNLPYTTDDLGDSVEEKYSDVLKRNNTLTASTDVEGSLDVTSFAGSNTQHKSGKRQNWKVMENYRKRCKSKRLWCPFCMMMYGNLTKHLQRKHPFLPKITRMAIMHRSQGRKISLRVRDQLKLFRSRLELKKLPLDKLIQIPPPMTVRKLVQLLLRIRLH